MTDYDEYLIEKFNVEYAPYFHSKEFYDLIGFFISGGLTVESLEAAVMFYVEAYLVANASTVVANWNTWAATGDTFAADQITLWTGWGLSFVGTTI